LIVTNLIVTKKKRHCPTKETTPLQNKYSPRGYTMYPNPVNHVPGNNRLDWSLLRTIDEQGRGIIANNSQHNKDAVNNGCQILATGFTPEEACQIRNQLKAITRN
jgi:hypothetical protein